MTLLDRIIGVPPAIDMEAVGRSIYEYTDSEVEAEETKSYAPFEVPLAQSTSDFIKYGYTDAQSASAAMGLYDQSSFVSIPINKVSKPFSTIQPVLWNMRTKEATNDHKVLDLLRSPCAGFTQELFFKTLANHFLITGEADIVAAGTVTRPPLEITPVSPADVSPVEGEDGLPALHQVSGMYYNGVYKAEIVDRNLRFFDEGINEFYMIRDYSTNRGSRIRGQSLLKSASRDVRQAVLGTEHNVSMLEKGGRLSLIFNFETDMSPDDYRETKKRILAQYGGASKAGQIGVTNGEKLKLVNMGSTNVEMDYANLTEQIKQTLALLYDVPLPLVSLSASTMNNYEIANLALWDDAVLPLARVILGGLSELLLPRYGMDLGEWRLVVDREQITALMMRTLEELKSRSAIGIETRDEMRAVLGRERTAGGNQFYVNSTMIPDGTDLTDEDGEMFDESGTSPIPQENEPEETEPSRLAPEIAASIAAISRDVSDGTMDRDGAAKLIALFSDLSEEEALEILGEEPEEPKAPPTIPPKPTETEEEEELDE